MKPLFHFADLWKCFVRLFKNVDRVTTEEGSALLAEDNVAIDGNLAVTGEVTAGAESEWQVFENIVDKDGHKRFIEDDITMGALTGVTQTYGKWSLSGTHLMIVLAIDIANGAVLPDSQNLAIVGLPDWIKEKLVALYNEYVTYGTFKTIGPSTDTDINFALIKTATNIVIKKGGGVYTAARDESVRIQFDLLIDNE